jgi:hypothetical protein
VSSDVFSEFRSAVRKLAAQKIIFSVNLRHDFATLNSLRHFLCHAALNAETTHAAKAALVESHRQDMG